MSGTIDESTKKSLQKIPLLKTNAGPRDEELWLERLREEYESLITFINNNKASDSDWFRLESNTDGTRWFGKCWHFHNMIKYEFDVEFDIPITYPKTAPEIAIPELDGKTAKMYRGGKICLSDHFKPLWARNVPKFGIAHAFSLGLGPWLAVEVPDLVDRGVICQLYKDPGYKCGLSVPINTYYFNPESLQCTEFIFYGCGGNSNRFINKEECEIGCGDLTKCGNAKLPLMDFAGNIKHCDSIKLPCPSAYECIGIGLNSVCCLKPEKICSLSINAGHNCGPPTYATRFFYDSSSKLCRPFMYKGCGGNENNFKTKGDCLKYCAIEVICLKGDPYAINNNIMKCASKNDCPKNYTCTSKKACCPSSESICGSPVDSRTKCLNQSSKHVWTFNLKKGYCEQIEVLSCNENLNSFVSLDQCQDFCLGSCPSSAMEAQINQYLNQPQLCNTEEDFKCSVGFECITVSSFSSLCCRTQPTCPSPESIIYTNEATIFSSIRCAPDQEHNCPIGYTCQQEYICCTPPMSCPYGMEALREQFNRPHICTPGVTGSCPVDYFCIRVANNNNNFNHPKHICCKASKICESPYVNETSKRTKKCFPGEGNCPEETKCLEVTDFLDKSNAENHVFYCCHTSINIF